VKTIWDLTFRKLKSYLSHTRPTVFNFITVSDISVLCSDYKGLGVMLVNCIFIVVVISVYRENHAESINTKCGVN
jgi:hypothetical protein